MTKEFRMNLVTISTRLALNSTLTNDGDKNTTSVLNNILDMKKSVPKDALCSFDRGQRPFDHSGPATLRIVGVHNRLCVGEPWRRHELKWALFVYERPLHLRIKRLLLVLPRPINRPGKNKSNVQLCCM
jgi:hypothetical protein